VSHVGDRVVGDLEQLSRGGQEAPAGGGEHDAAAAALEQRPELPFEARHALGQRLLGERERLRRAAEAPVIDHRDECAHLREVEVHQPRLRKPLVVVASQKLLDTPRGGW
jgi:hypothetical protein